MDFSQLRIHLSHISVATDLLLIALVIISAFLPHELPPKPAEIFFKICLALAVITGILGLPRKLYYARDKMGPLKSIDCTVSSCQHSTSRMEKSLISGRAKDSFCWIRPCWAHLSFCTCCERLGRH
jgi:hypothetical protein